MNMSANLTYRSSLTPPLNTSTVLKGKPLTNAEIDSNWFTLNTEVDLKAPIESPVFTGTVTFSTTGALALPVGTIDQRPDNSTNGMIRYNSTLNTFEGFRNGSWGSIGSGATGGLSDQVFYENDKTITSSYEITKGRNAMATGPLTVAEGAIVTVPDGTRLYIL